MISLPFWGPSLLIVMVPCLMGTTGGLDIVMVVDTEGTPELVASGLEVVASGLEADSAEYKLQI